MSLRIIIHRCPVHGEQSLWNHQQSPFLDSLKFIMLCDAYFIFPFFAEKVQMLPGKNITSFVNCLTNKDWAISGSSLLVLFSCSS